MSAQVSQAEMQNFAEAIWMLARAEPIEAQAALAWLVINRMKLAAGQRCAGGKPAARYGDGSLAEACKSVLADEGLESCPATLSKAGFEDSDFCRAFALVCQVWNRDQIDPAEGAIDFHRHDQNPDWAANRTPSALIGRRFFYP